MAIQIKICGLTSVQDAQMALEAGADALGLNFWKNGKRYCDPKVARNIVRTVGGNVQIVGVFVDAPLDDILELRQQVGFSWVQLHGDEGPDLLKRLLPDAYKALRVRDDGVLEQHLHYGGEHLLLDAYVPGVPGGSGQSFDWALAAQVAKLRKVTLAGGLVPQNVAQAIKMVKPFRVDVSSGVEKAPGQKDAEKVKAFVKAAKEADVQD